MTDTPTQEAIDEQYKNSLMFCQYCEIEGIPKEKCWIPYSQYNKHRDTHAQAIADTANRLIDDPDVEKRIIAILEKSPSARAKPSELLDIYFRSYPFNNYRIEYIASNGHIRFPEFESYEDALDFTTALSNVARKDRHVRSVVRPDLNASPRARKKEILAETSRVSWYGKSHQELGNVYVPSGDIL